MSTFKLSCLKSRRIHLKFTIISVYYCVEGGNQELRHLPVLLKGNFTQPISVHKLSKTVYCDDVICVGYHLNGACQPTKRSLDCLQIIPESDTSPVIIKFSDRRSQIITLNLQLERNKMRRRGIPISSPGRLSLIMLSILYNLCNVMIIQTCSDTLDDKSNSSYLIQLLHY